MRYPYLITGAAGFIGARFVDSCHKKHIPVISVDTRSFFSDRPEHREIDFGERIDRDELLHWLETKKPQLEAVIHMGACSSTMETDESVFKKLNIEYSQKLWNFCARENTPLIYASSAATYGDGLQGFSDEESLLLKLQPLNLYGKSKQAFDLWALGEEKRGSRPPSWAGFKFFNVYGFGERHKGVQASVALHAFDQIRESGQLELFRSHRPDVAHGEQKRDFVFIDDVVEILHQALEKPVRRGIFNLGTGQARSYLDLARATFRAMKQPERIEFIDTPLSIRDKYQYFTEAKMEKLKSEGLNLPFTSLEAGVESYVRKLLRSS